MNVLRSVVPNQAWLLKGRRCCLIHWGAIVPSLSYSCSSSSSPSISHLAIRGKAGTLTRPRFLVAPWGGKTGTLLTKFTYPRQTLPSQ